MQQLRSDKEVAAAIEKLCSVIAKQLPSDMPVALIGIRTRGETLAQRMAPKLAKMRPDVQFLRGVLDITFYRDDLSRQRGAPMVRATEIDFDLDDTWVLVVDDVLQTGRSIRAAMDALYDFGRPKIIRLAVLVDRGGREVPISADFVSETIKAPAGQRVQVRFKENDGIEGVFLIPRSGD